MNIFRLLVVLSFVVVNSSAMAQTAAAAPAAAPASAPGASPCAKPGHYPGKKASDARKEAWMNEMRAWGKCTTAFRDDLRAQIDALVKVANTTTEEYNAGLKELQEEQKAAEEAK